MKSFFLEQLFDTLRRYEDKVAIVDKPYIIPSETAIRRTTFGQLFVLARKVAGYIQKQGIQPQSYITIELYESMEFMAVEIGVWMARCVAVPVGVNFPEERKAYIREHCESVLHIDKDNLDAVLAGEEMAEAVVHDELDLMLLVYTSGSTGTPKGVLHDYLSWMRAIESLNEGFHPSAEDSFAAYIPAYFLVQILYFLLLYGTEIHIIDGNLARDIKALAEYHREHNITIAYVSATVYPLYECVAPTLRTVITGSDRVVCPRKPTFQLLCYYGLSESAGPVMYADIRDVTDNAPIGLPTSGVELALLDEEMKPVADGEDGEICLRGHFTKGYFKDEAQTEKLYRGGWLHTNDLGRRLPDGRILFVNRKDWMVKVNGQRVEPGEVEAAMRKVDGVQRAVVKGFAGNQGSQYLVGYYSVEQGKEVAEDAVRELLEATLPSYMVPTFLVRMEQFPLNANGKVDRKSLLPPTGETRQSAYVAPTNEVEKVICEAFAEVLGLERVGIDDDFVRLGGDSIRIMRLQQLFNQRKPAALTAVLTTTTINRGRTPRNIAQLLENHVPQSFESREAYPLNDMQMLYCMMGSLRPDQPVTNLPMLYRLDDGIDMQRMAHAIEQVVANHKAFAIRLGMGRKNGLVNGLRKIGLKPIANGLQLLFSLTGGVKQSVQEDFVYRQSIEEMSDEEMTGNLTRQLVQPHKLIETPLFRFRLIQTPSAKYLFMDVSHVIFDGDSMAIVIDDINKAYLDQPLEKENWTLLNAVMAEKQFQSSEAEKLAFKWYKEKLKNVPQGVFPRPDKQGGAVAIRQLVCPLGLDHATLQQQARQMGCSVNVLTTAAFSVLLSRYSGSRQVALSLAYNAREDYRTDRTVGMLSHGIFLNTAVDTETLDKAHVDRVKDYMLTGMSNCFISVLKLMKTGVKMMKVMPFLYQGERQSAPEIGGKPAKNIKVPIEMEAGMSMAVHFLVEDGAAQLLVFYHDELYSEQYVRQMAADYAELLKTVS